MKDAPLFNKKSVRVNDIFPVFMSVTYTVSLFELLMLSKAAVFGHPSMIVILGPLYNTKGM